MRHNYKVTDDMWLVVGYPFPAPTPLYKGRYGVTLGDYRWPNPQAFEQWNKRNAWGDRVYEYMSIDEFLDLKPRFAYELDPTKGI